MTHNLTLDDRSRILAVYQLIAYSLLIATAGAFIGLHNLEFLTGATYFVLVAVEFALIFALILSKKILESTNLSMIMLFLFTFISGLTLAPTIARYLSSSSGVETLVTALLATGVVVGSLSFFAAYTKKDFSVYRQVLFIALIGVIVLALLNLFLSISWFGLLISYLVLIVFSFYMIMDTQTLIKGEYKYPVVMALSIYLDILNIFSSLLSILGSRD